MNVEVILRVAQILIYIILGGLAIWFKSNDKLRSKVAEFINTAEGMFTDTTKAGGERFEWVVNALYGLFPKVLQTIIPKSFVETIVQNVFDQMKDFAKKNLDAAASNITEDITEEVTEAIEDKTENDTNQESE